MRATWTKYLPTAGEAELLELLKEYQSEYRRLPSLRHAARLLGLTHGAVQQRLVGLMLLGYVRRPAPRSSALELVPGVPLVGEVD